MQQKIDDCPYQRIEYLEVSAASGGRHYIDTGYVPQGRDIEISTTFELLGFSADVAWCDIWCAYTSESANTYRVIRNLSNNTLIFYNGTLTSGTINDVGGVVGRVPEVFNKKYNVYINGIEYFECNGETQNFQVAIASRENTGNLMIFTTRTGLAYCRFYSFKLKKAGELILDLIPVRVGDEGYMYNRVTGELLNGKVPGRFILGPDIQ